MIHPRPKPPCDVSRAQRTLGIVIVVQNLSVPLDRRVYQQAQALVDDGWRVHVICPKSAADPARRETKDGVTYYRHWVPKHGGTMLGLIWEYIISLSSEFALLTMIALRHGLAVIQVCNPPDFLAIVAAPFRLFGASLVFDKHDDVPALFEIKFRLPVLAAALRLFERLTIGFADVVLCAGETYRETIIRQGHKNPALVHTIYSVPDPRVFVRENSNRELRRGRALAIGYVGLIGAQDGVDRLIQCLWHLVHDHGWNSVQLIVVGDGDRLQSVRREAQRLSLMDRITFTGLLHGRALRRAISTFDVGVIPDPKNSFTDQCPMNKAFEYAMLGIPVVSTPLREVSRILGDAGVLAEDDSAAALAAACDSLLADEVSRANQARLSEALFPNAFCASRELTAYCSIMRSVVR